MTAGKKLIIFGSGSFAEYAIYVFQNDSFYEVVALTVEAAFRPTDDHNHCQLPVVCFEEVEEIYPPSEYLMFIAVGNNWLRQRLFEESRKKGFQFASYLSSKALHWDDLVHGDHVFIGDASFIQPFVGIGQNSVIFASTVGHHAKIGENVLLSGCTLGGNTEIGCNSFVGMNAAIKQDVKVGKNNIIGMGCSITHDTNNDEVYSSSSSRKREISSQRIKDRYL